MLIREKVLPFMLSIFIFAACFVGTEPAYAADNQVINIVLDPGHGGTDYGATSVGGLEFQEKNITFKLAQYIQLELRKYSGVSVNMTRYAEDRKSVV